MAKEPVAPQRELSFWKRPGEGIIYTKPATDAVIRSGQVCLPDLGTCYIEGLQSYATFRGDDETPIKLTLKQRIEGVSTIVGHLQMPGKQGVKRRDAVITTAEKRKSSRQAWKAVVTVQYGAAGPYLRVFIPEVASMRSPGRAQANGVAVG